MLERPMNWAIPILATAVLAMTTGATWTGEAASAGTATANCSRTSVGFTALSDLVSGTYHGFAGGLYTGSNQPSTQYQAAGQRAAGLVRALGPTGEPSTDGKIGVLSIGMSNASYEFSALMNDLGTARGRNQRVVFFNGAASGQTADVIDTPTAPYWQSLDSHLSDAGLSAGQVQVVWLKDAIANPTGTFPTSALQLKADLASIVDILTSKFANLRLVYVSSRTYAGYATVPLNPEPYAYESGFAVKWLIADAADSARRRPWIGWGPYIWTDGLRGRSDGFKWTCDDVLTDGTHPSATGRAKVGQLLLTFFETDPTAKTWFLADMPR